MKAYCYLILCSLILLSCKDPQARRPVKVKSGSFLKESVERNRMLLSRETHLIRQAILADSTRSYQASPDGFWYTYLDKKDSTAYQPVEDDLVFLTYDLRNLRGDTLYSEEEIGTVSYRVDKQELFPGLRAAVRMMREGESAMFMFPSAQAYGYTGDNQRIGPNTPVVSTVSILKIEPQLKSE